MSQNVNLYIDFGNDYTKATAIDIDQELVLGFAKIRNKEDVAESYEKVLEELTEKTGSIEFKKKLACSNLNGGLKVIVVGLVNRLSTDAGKKSVDSSGAEVIKTFSNRLTSENIAEIEKLNADVLLLCGGTDGGNKDSIIYNAKKLVDVKKNMSVIVAGNKHAADICKSILESSFSDVRIAENVLPDQNILNINSVKTILMEIFIDTVFRLSQFKKIQKTLTEVIMPTSSSIQVASRLLSNGSQNEAGFGELVLCDVSENSIDIYSVCKNQQFKEDIPIEGIPEVYEKHTVERDFNLNFELPSFIDSEKGKEKSKKKINEITFRTQLQIAMEKHAGRIEMRISPSESFQVQVGKNLSNIKYIVGTGDIILNGKNPENILEGLTVSHKESNSLTPREVEYYIDTSNCVYAFGLLSVAHSDKALKIMKKFLKKIE